jgi:nitroreductase
MKNPKTSTNTQSPLSVMNAIQHRRSVRDYTSQSIDKSVIQMLLGAAVLAPTAMHEEPWAFAVIQDKKVLDRLSERAKKLALTETQGSDTDRARHKLHVMDKPDFHVFYNAGTLIVIYSKLEGQFVVADCWLAAENLLLAAYAQGLGTCVIGFAVSALNTPEWKAELKIPTKMTAIAPMIVGVPAGVTPLVPRKPPEIVSWI